MSLTGAARLAGIMGWPVAHSRSPLLHGFWLDEAGIDGAYLPHVHRKIDSEFVIITGHGHVSRNAEWSPYRPRTRLSVGMGIAHGFITDPDFGPTVFLSIQSDPIRKISIDPVTHAEKSEDDFVYADEAYPLPRDLLELRKQKLSAYSRKQS